jgi:cytochrome P450
MQQEQASAGRSTIERYARSFPPLLPSTDVFDAVRYLLDTCPVTRSDLDDGFWIVNAYDDSLRVLQDSQAFPVGRADGPGAVRVPKDPPGMNRPTTPPIDVNPPMHRQFRELLNPYLSPQRLTTHETHFREIIVDLLDAFIESGEIDFATGFAKVFPAQLTFKELFGIEDIGERDHARFLIRKLTYDLFREEPAKLAVYQRDLNDWIKAFLDRRRKAPRRDDIIDGILHGTIDGHPLDEMEMMGTVQILIFGGFSTTADAAGNVMVTLIDRPDLQELLYEDPGLIPPFVEEVLRLDPPVTSRARRCAVDTELRGQEIHVGDRVLVSFVSANRDPAEFSRPDELDLDREHNRHLTFSGGVHRCIGSTMARMTLRMTVEAVLARMRDIRFPDDLREVRGSFGVGQWRAVDSLPIVYTRRQKETAAS